ncbi:hypothetical protein PMAYCL1PPCAC_13929, partial [Pristionchus mayeri]
MSKSSTSLSTVEEWNRKAFDFSDTEDSLNNVFLNLFDVLSAILKNSNPRAVQHALESLKSER